jgi:hypothetical protein
MDQLDANIAPPLDTASEKAERATSHRMLEAADTCFEMFSLRELKNPDSILNELTDAFPDLPMGSVFAAISLAVSWKRLLRSPLRRLH